MQTYFSHARKKEDGQREGSKYLFAHTKGVRDIAIRQLHQIFGFSLNENFSIQEVVNTICLYHDLGKYTSFFQDYLLGRPFSQRLKQHARFGAQAVLQKYGLNTVIGLAAYLVVKNHHRNLHTPDSGAEDQIIDSRGYKEVREVFEAQKQDIFRKVKLIQQELGITDLESELNLPDKKAFFRFVKDLKKTPDTQHYFLINYLFSLLIEADKLDASDAVLYQTRGISSEVVSKYISGFGASNNFQNQLRNEVRREVLKNLQRDDTHKTKVFMLTAPTGIGKTLTALDFAVRLRTKLPHQPQIVVGLPFINIIEQTLGVYEKVFKGLPIKILGHYQYADIFSEQNDSKEDSEPDYNRRRMELDTWQSDIVVTSFVQLLQTMVSNRNKLLLKFNHLAGAIVIMDEVQSLRLEQTPFIGAVLYLMSKYLDTRFVLMTATKPLIFELAEAVLLKEEGHSPTQEVFPLLPEPERYFKQFNRTQIIPLNLGEKLADTNAFIEQFQELWSTDKSCLIVCNTVNRSIEVFEGIQAILDQATKVFYLSTNVLPLLRLGIIEEIKQALNSGEKPILVSTQVVEAGVDLDFDMGFRDLAPVDSIVQVAGRINRENAPERSLAPLYVFNLGDCQRIYGPITDGQAIKALGVKPISEPEYFGLVEAYFQNVSQKNAYDTSEKLFKGLKYLQYSEVTIHEDVTPIWKFRVIEESPSTVSVYVDWDESGEQARVAYLEMINASDRDTGFQLKAVFDQEHKRAFHQRIISVPNRYAEMLPSIDLVRPDFPIKWVSNDIEKDWYLEPIGFVRRSERLANEGEKAIQL